MFPSHKALFLPVIVFILVPDIAATQEKPIVGLIPKAQQPIARSETFTPTPESETYFMGALNHDQNLLQLGFQLRPAVVEGADFVVCDT